MGYSEECRKYFKRTFNREYSRNLGTRTSLSAKKNAELFAQKKAMQKTLIYGIEKFYPGNTVRDIWEAIRRAHIQQKIGASYGKRIVLDDAVAENIFAAFQSWDKASGHAFEEYIPQVLNTILQPYHISVVLQKDLTAMLNSTSTVIFNNAEQIEWLREQVVLNVFDLYAIQELNGEKYVFGCLQSKTSIRDRVTRDREPSIQAMEKRFWSVGVTLNGDFFKNQKFQNMVNGGTTSYPKNGWHGMYVIESPFYGQRIFEFEKFAEHAVKAARTWRSDHESLDNTWNPSVM